MSKTYGSDGNSKDKGGDKKRPPKPKGRPKEFVPPEVVPLLEALQVKGTASGSDLQDQLVALGHYISEQALNKWVDNYRKGKAAKQAAIMQRNVEMKAAEHAPDLSAPEHAIIDVSKSLSALPDDMLLVVDDMLRGRRSTHAIRVQLASFGYTTTDDIIEAYAQEHQDDINPVDMAGRLASAIKMLEARTRIIDEQAVRVWRNMSAKAKQDVKTYLALTKLGFEGRRAIIEALKQVPTQSETNDVNAALQAIEAKLGIERECDSEEQQIDHRQVIEEPAMEPSDSEPAQEAPALQ